MTDRRHRLILQGRNEQKQLKIERRRRNREPHSGFRSGACIVRIYF